MCPKSINKRSKLIGWLEKGLAADGPANRRASFIAQVSVIDQDDGIQPAPAELKVSPTFDPPPPRGWGRHAKACVHVTTNFDKNQFSPSRQPLIHPVHGRTLLPEFSAAKLVVDLFQRNVPVEVWCASAALPLKPWRALVTGLARIEHRGEFTSALRQLLKPKCRAPQKGVMGARKRTKVKNCNLGEKKKKKTSGSLRSGKEERASWWMVGWFICKTWDHALSFLLWAHLCTRAARNKYLMNMY